MQAYGATSNGGFAEYSVVSENNIVPIGEMSKVISHELSLSDIATYFDGPHAGGSMKVQYKAF